MRASLDPRGVSPRMLPLVPSQCRAGCSGEPSATQNPSKDAPRRPEIFRKHGKSTRLAAGEKIPPMSNTLFQVLVFGFLFVLVALCLCRLHRPLFFVVSSTLHTSSPKRPAWAADCFLTHTVRDRPRSGAAPPVPSNPVRHRPRSGGATPTFPPKCCSCHQPHRARTNFGRNPVPGFCSCPAPDLVGGRGPFRPKSCSRTTDLVGRDFLGRNHMW